MGNRKFHSALTEKSSNPTATAKETLWHHPCSATTCITCYNLPCVTVLIYMSMHQSQVYQRYRFMITKLCLAYAQLLWIYATEVPQDKFFFFLFPNPESPQHYLHAYNVNPVAFLRKGSTEKNPLFWQYYGENEIFPDHAWHLWNLELSYVDFFFLSSLLIPHMPSAA